MLYPTDIDRIMSIRGEEDRAAVETRFRYHKARADKAFRSLGRGLPVLSCGLQYLNARYL